MVVARGFVGGSVIINGIPAFVFRRQDADDRSAGGSGPATAVTAVDAAG